MLRILAFALLLPLPAMADAVIAARTLRPGMVLAASDVMVATAVDGPFSRPDQVVGQQLQAMVSKGRPITPAQLSAPILIERNQLVTLVYDRASLRIEAEGRALGPGAVGQVIRIMNNNSRVTVSGRVAADGTVVIGQN
ncbi:MAG: flagellar basal body P-ring formation chaperone FlgA [Paracoccus sp. (in: a-proteobacteria)]|uniref:flagellar basal body P-ring formation chaperone FlgA n=1 Tax=Paracoccus sp. TaxID=267 RepID=UPI0039E4830F